MRFEPSDRPPTVCPCGREVIDPDRVAIEGCVHEHAAVMINEERAWAKDWPAVTVDDVASVAFPHPLQVVVTLKNGRAITANGHAAAWVRKGR